MDDPNLLGDSEPKSNSPKGWREWRLFEDGKRFESGCQPFPATTRVAEKIMAEHEIVVSISFLLLWSGTELERHVDRSNWFVTHWLCVVIPEGCGLEVGGRTAALRAGHRSSRLGDRYRVIQPLEVPGTSEIAAKIRRHLDFPQQLPHHQAMEVTWSEAKRRENLQKHGIDFRDAADVFADPRRISIFDQEHNLDEDRWWTLGIARSRVLFVVHLEWDDECYRIISARKAKANERNRYYDS